MPAPRFVRRNSTSAFRSVSIFSGKLGTAWATAGVAAGTGERNGAGDPVALPSGSVGVGEATVVRGRGGVCFATHNSHKTSPTTQSITTIHAVRSIKLPAAAHSQKKNSVASRIRISLDGGTGSCPQPPHGWQRPSRLHPRQ